MSRNKYKKITFAKGYNKSLAEFKKEFDTDFHFANLKSKEKTKEMRKAWKMATKGNEPKKSKPKEKLKSETDELPTGDKSNQESDKGEHNL